MTDSKIIVALDFDDKNQALHLVEQLNPALCHLKIGKEMFTRFGPTLVHELQNKHFSIFLDLKFHDIPHTVARACLAAADLGVWMMNVHALGGRKMLEASREALDKITGPKPLLIGVTVLTSMDATDVAEVGLVDTVQAQVIRLAKLVQASGLDGVVCSGLEAAAIRQVCGKDFKLITPGIRLSVGDQDDQKRILTPKMALAAGANYLVIGRPITAAANPLQILEEIYRQINVH